MHKVPNWDWKFKPRATKDLDLCHGDLSAHNIPVDPETLKVQTGNMQGFTLRNSRACSSIALDRPWPLMVRWMICRHWLIF